MKKTKDAIKRQLKEQWEQACGGFLVELPEAMKYLTFPEVKAVPMPVFTGLRDIIGSIKEDSE